MERNITEQSRTVHTPNSNKQQLQALRQSLARYSQLKRVPPRIIQPDWWLFIVGESNSAKYHVEWVHARRKAMSRTFAVLNAVDTGSFAMMMMMMPDTLTSVNDDDVWNLFSIQQATTATPANLSSTTQEFSTQITGKTQQTVRYNVVLRAQKGLESQLN